MGQNTVLESLLEGESKRFLDMDLRNKVWCTSHRKSTVDSKQKWSSFKVQDSGNVTSM